MPFTVLKVPPEEKEDEVPTEVLGEFPDEKSAEKFAACAKAVLGGDGYEYPVESPPGKDPNKD